MNTECNHCNPGTTHAPEYNTAGSCETPPTQLTTVTIRKDQGGDAPTDPYAPVLGAWQNTIVYYQKNGAVYLYDVNGVYTNLTGTDWGPQIAEALETAQSASASASQTASALSAAQAQWTARFNTVTGELTSLQSALTAETTAREQGDQSLSEQLSSLTTQVNEIGADVTEQETTLTEAVSDLQTNINAETNARTESDAALQENIDANTNAIANLEAAIGSEAGGFTKEIMLDLSAAAGASTVTLTKTTGNLGTTVTTDTEIALPTASATQAGILSAADYEKFSAGGSEGPKVPGTVVGGGTIPLQLTMQSKHLKLNYNYMNSSTGETNSYSDEFPAATPSADGIMSYQDKTKLNALPAIKAIGANLELTDDGTLNALASGSMVLPSLRYSRSNTSGAATQGDNVNYTAITFNQIASTEPIAAGSNTQLDVSIPELGERLGSGRSFLIGSYAETPTTSAAALTIIGASLYRTNSTSSDATLRITIHNSGSASPTSTLLGLVMLVPLK